MHLTSHSRPCLAIVWTTFLPSSATVCHLLVVVLVYSCHMRFALVSVGRLHHLFGRYGSVLYLKITAIYSFQHNIHVVKLPGICGILCAKPLLKTTCICGILCTKPRLKTTTSWTNPLLKTTTASRQIHHNFRSNSTTLNSPELVVNLTSIKITT